MTTDNKCSTNLWKKDKKEILYILDTLAEAVAILVKKVTDLEELKSEVEA